MNSSIVLCTPVPHFASNALDEPHASICLECLAGPGRCGPGVSKQALPFNVPPSELPRSNASQRKNITQ